MNYNFKKIGQVGTAHSYIRLHVGHCNVCVKFDFSDRHLKYIIIYNRYPHKTSNTQTSEKRRDHNDNNY